MTATCHQPGCPQRGRAVDVGDADRVLCGGCQHPITHLTAEPPKPTRRKRTHDG